MGWAENRIQSYQHGQPATWLERRMLEHANPVHFTLALAAWSLLIYGLWTHQAPHLVLALLLGFAGHLYSWVQK